MQINDPVFIDTKPKQLNRSAVDRVYADIWTEPVVIASEDGKITIDHLIEDFNFMNSNIRVLIKSTVTSSGEDITLYCLFRENANADRAEAMKFLMMAEEFIVE